MSIRPTTNQAKTGQRKPSEIKRAAGSESAQGLQPDKMQDR